VKLLDTCPQTVNEAALEISRLTKAEVVHIIGHTIILYKASEKGIYQI
jgi:RNA-binding protein